MHRKIHKFRLFCIFVCILISVCSIAYSYDLSDFPDFLSDPVYIVVGVGAKSSDVVGAIDIAVSLVKAGKNVCSRLDTEIDELDKDMIVVGGPCVNAVAAKLLDFPDDCMEGFDLGVGKIVLFENNDAVQILVAGATAYDTRVVSRILANYDNPKNALSGNEVTIRTYKHKELMILD